MSLPLSIVAGQVAYIGRIDVDRNPEFYPYKSSLPGAPVDIIPAADSEPIGLALNTAPAGTACEIVKEGLVVVPNIASSLFLSPGDPVYANISNGNLQAATSAFKMGFLVFDDTVYVRVQAT